MKSGKVLFFLFIFVFAGNTVAVTGSSATSSMAVPSGEQGFPPYSLTPSPVVSGDPSQALPVGVGSVATGGSTVSLQIALGQFSGPVDLYFGIYAPSTDPDNMYLLMPNDTLQPFSVQTGTVSQLSPWVANSSGNINTSLFGNIPVSALPSGTYYFYLLATPAGRLDSYYLWTTAGYIGGEVTPPVQTNNVLPVTVNGGLCSVNSYANEPCVSVTVCTPGTSSCQTINDILLDTGSYGLRIFKQALNVPLTQESVSDGALAECIQYGDGSSDWGPVQTASVILGNEPAVLVPIQVIDSTFGVAPRGCSNADISPSDTGFNGILGVGFFAQDCGQACASIAGNEVYYVCSGTSCVETTVALSGQVQNPVALLPQDNNGVIVKLPSVPEGGVPSLNGSLVLGIGTQPNNIPSAVTAYGADDTYGEFITMFGGTLYNSFLDTGSNGLFFPSPSASQLPDCPSPNSYWYCPSSMTSFTATNTGASGSPSGGIPFSIANANSLYNSPNNVFPDLGGTDFGEFDWGLPFFFGRNVYVGMEGTASSLGIGPYWAY